MGNGPIDRILHKFLPLSALQTPEAEEANSFTHWRVLCMQEPGIPAGSMVAFLTAPNSEKGE